jgi:hypothetical protein
MSAHMLIPLTPERVEALRARVAEHGPAGGDRCAAPGCRDRWPCWYRRDAAAQLAGADISMRPGR